MNLYITEKKLMEMLDISRSTLYRYKTKLGLPFNKIGNKSFYNLNEVEDFISKHSSDQFKNFLHEEK